MSNGHRQIKGCPSAVEPTEIGPRNMDPKLTAFWKGRGIRFSSDVPVVVLKSRSGGRQEKGVRDGGVIRVFHGS
jgi:hypothetical protein